MPVATAERLGGGCISESYRVTLNDGRTWFCKWNEPNFADNFAAEADGLSAIAATRTIRVPNLIAADIDERQGVAFLVLEYIAPGRTSKSFFRLFGESLARLHQADVGKRFGWSRDNYLGATRQQNKWHDRWIEFVRSQRLEPQLKWATDRGLANRELITVCERLIHRLDEVLAGGGPRASLLHGDLWSGNYFSDPDGQPVVIDPAVYVGHREAEFGMLKLFGGCPAEFYEAYSEVLPFESGAERRIEVYRLYHLLNHLNLFGASYHESALSVAKSLV